MSINFFSKATKPRVVVSALYIPNFSSVVKASDGDCLVPSPSFKLPVDKSVPPAVTWNISSPI